MHLYIGCYVPLFIAMIITDIKLKKKALVELYVDGKLVANIDINIVAEHKLKKMQEIDEEYLQELIRLSDEHRAKQRAMFLLSRKDYCEKELFDKLSKAYNEQAAQLAVDRMKELKFIDDERYAIKYAKDLLFRKHLAKRRAQYEMMRKGLDKELVEETLKQIETEPVEEIIQILQSKFALALSDEKGRRRAVNNLLRKGYNYEDIKVAITRLSDEELL